MKGIKVDIEEPLLNYFLEQQPVLPNGQP